MAPGAAGQSPYQAPQRGRQATAEIGALFRDLRRILQLSLPDLAARIGTRIEVVTALERGEIERLPPWPETMRVVTTYTSMARIDPRPVLTIIRQEMDLHASTAAPGRRHRLPPLNSLARATAAATARVVSTTRSAASVAWGARGAISQSWVQSDTADMDVDDPRSGAWLGRSGIMVLLLLSLTLGTYLVRTAGMEGAMADLKAPVARLVGKAHDYIMRQTARAATGSEQLKWVNVDDPRSRRSDRLQSDPR